MSFLSFLGDIVGGMFGMSAQQSANQTNMELAKYAFDRNVDMWRMQNEYNTPAQQMERLKAAGLNPNLVYGSGSVVGNTSGSAPEYKPPSVNPVSNGGFISNAVQHGLFNDAQLRQIKAQTHYTETQSTVADAQLSKIAAETAESLQRTARSKFDLELAQDLRRNSIEVANANLERIKSTTAYQNVSTAMQQAKLELIPLEKQLSASRIAEINTSIQNVLWDLETKKAGFLPGTDVLSWLTNQIIRQSKGMPSALDGIFVSEQDKKNIKRAKADLLTRKFNVKAVPDDLPNEKM